MFSKGLSKGSLVKDLYDLDWDLGEASPGSIDERKVSTLCEIQSEGGLDLIEFYLLDRPCNAAKSSMSGGTYAGIMDFLL